MTPVFRWFHLGHLYPLCWDGPTTSRTPGLCLDEPTLESLDWSLHLNKWNEVAVTSNSKKLFWNKQLVKYNKDPHQYFSNMSELFSYHLLITMYLNKLRFGISIVGFVSARSMLVDPFRFSSIGTSWLFTPCLSERTCRGNAGVTTWVG